MKSLFLLSILSILSACTTYTATTRLSKQKVMVSKQTTVLWFWGGTVFTCDTDKDWKIQSCVENEIETKEAQEARLEREKKSMEAKQQRASQSSSSEEPKRTSQTSSSQ